MTLVLDLPEPQMEALRALADRLGVPVERLAQAALSDLTSRGDPTFNAAAMHVLAKNADLYERLR